MTKKANKINKGPASPPGSLKRSAFPFLSAFFLPKQSNESIHDELDKMDNIDRQFIRLRNLTSLGADDVEQRRLIIQQLIDWIYRKGEIFEAIAFGSSVNGLGFRDSDLDLKLSPIRKTQSGLRREEFLPDKLVMDYLKRINYGIRSAGPVDSVLIKSKRCPITKLEFRRATKHFRPVALLDASLHGIKIDISISATDNLAPYNTEFMSFLCQLEPRFQLLGLAVRRWSQAHDLIRPGKMSSYALTNMLIYFCQLQSPPLLPIVDDMRDIDPNLTPRLHRGWNYATCQDLDKYEPSQNREPLLLLLVKFFELLLMFPYSTHLFNIRSGRALTKVEFENSVYYSEDFEMNNSINIQDPFDLGHNLTRGSNFFYLEDFQAAARLAYNRACDQLYQNTDCGPSSPINPDSSSTSIAGPIGTRQHWGLTVLLEPVKYKKVPMIDVLTAAFMAQNSKPKGNKNDIIPTITVMANSDHRPIFVTNEFILYHRITRVEVMVHMMLDILSNALDIFVNDVLFSQQVVTKTYSVKPYAFRVFKEVTFIDTDFESMEKRAELRKWPAIYQKSKLDEAELQKFFRDVIINCRRLKKDDKFTSLNVTVYVICDWRYPGLPIFNVVPFNGTAHKSGKYSQIFLVEYLKLFWEMYDSHGRN